MTSVSVAYIRLHLTPIIVFYHANGRRSEHSGKGVRILSKRLFIIKVIREDLHIFYVDRSPYRCTVSKRLVERGFSSAKLHHTEVRPPYLLDMMDLR